MSCYEKSHESTRRLFLYKRKPTPFYNPLGGNYCSHFISHRFHLQ